VHLVEEVGATGGDAGSAADAQFFERLVNLVNERLTEASASAGSTPSLPGITTSRGVFFPLFDHWLLRLTFHCFSAILVVRNQTSRLLDIIDTV